MITIAIVALVKFNLRIFFLSQSIVEYLLLFKTSEKSVFFLQYIITDVIIIIIIVICYYLNPMPPGSTNLTYVRIRL